MECPKGLLSRIDLACINLNPFCKDAKSKELLDAVEEKNKELRKYLEKTFTMKCEAEKCENSQ